MKRKDEAAHGHYRTRDNALEVYDALQTAIDSDQPDPIRLTPPRPQPITVIQRRPPQPETR